MSLFKNRLQINGVSILVSGSPVRRVYLITSNRRPIDAASIVANSAEVVITCHWVVTVQRAGCRIPINDSIAVVVDTVTKFSCIRVDGWVVVVAIAITHRESITIVVNRNADASKHRVTNINSTRVAVVAWDWRPHTIAIPIFLVVECTRVIIVAEGANSRTVGNWSINKDYDVFKSIECKRVTLVMKRGSVDISLSPCLEGALLNIRTYTKPPAMISSNS